MGCLLMYMLDMDADVTYQIFPLQERPEKRETALFPGAHKVLAFYPDVPRCI